MSVTLEDLCILMYDTYESAAKRRGWHDSKRRVHSWGIVPEEKRAAIRDAVGVIEEAIRADERSKHDPEAVQADLRQIMVALDISTHARPYSPQQVVHKEILPKIRRLKNTLVEARAAIGRNYVEVRDILEEGGK